MHDCRKIEERLLDLSFAESGSDLNEEQRYQTIAEVEGCAFCLKQFESIQATLASFDEATALMQPAENYWQGYEARLRARLVADEQPSLWQRFVDAARSLAPQPAWAISVAALVLVALLAWAWFNRSTPLPNNQPPQETIAKPQMPSVPENKKQNDDIVIAPPEKKDGIKDGVAENRQLPRRKPARDVQPRREQQVAARVETQPRVVTEPTTAGVAVLAANLMPNSTIAAIVSEETLQHFEKSQLFLRAFRNLDFAGKESVTTIADERQRSRSLLFQNIVLRREAEMKGNLPVEQVLNNLEPVLLDIANLPDRATAEDVRAIRERIQRKAVVASLQAYSSRLNVAGAITD